MRRVEVEIASEGPAVQTTPDCDHPVLARHAALLMRTPLGTGERLRVQVSAPNLPAHLGLGSSSAQIAAVASAVNELYGRPVISRQLVKFLALRELGPPPGAPVSGDRRRARARADSPESARQGRGRGRSRGR
jgi:homoserine kinase